jgi:hypothetical protein
MGTNTVTHIPKAKIGAERENIQSVLDRGKAVQGAATGATTIYNGAPVTAAVFGPEVTDLDTKHQATKTNKNAVGARNASRDTVWGSLVLLLAFVNDLCRKQPDQAATIIDASGFPQCDVGHAVKPLVGLSATTNPGEVGVEANASQLLPPSGKKHTRKTWLYRHSVDGGKTWISDDPQPVARTLLKGLPAQVEVAVQVAVKDATGQSAWTQSYTITLLK